MPLLVGSCLATRHLFTQASHQAKHFAKTNSKLMKLLTRSDALKLLLTINSGTQFSVYWTAFVSNKTEIQNNNADSENSLLETLVQKHQGAVRITSIVAGKGPPPEPPLDCCMSGCANCVWIKYAESLKDYYKDGDERALKEINALENPNLKAFLKLEMNLE